MGYLDSNDVLMYINKCMHKILMALERGRDRCTNALYVSSEENSAALNAIFTTWLN